MFVHGHLLSALSSALSAQTTFKVNIQCANVVECHKLLMLLMGFACRVATQLFSSTMMQGILQKIADVGSVLSR